MCKTLKRPRNICTVGIDQSIQLGFTVLVFFLFLDVKTDWIVKVQTALKTHKSSTHVMDVDIINQKSIANALSQLDKMFTPANGLHS